MSQPRVSPAAAPGLTGNPPIPPGRPMIVRHPSPGEQAILEEYGWEPGQPVPENLADIIEATKNSASDLDNMPPPVDPRTPPIEQPDPIAIDDLPPQKQTEILGAIQQAMEASKVEYQEDMAIANAQIPGADPSVNDAIKVSMRGSMQVEDDRESDKYATGLDKEPLAEQVKNIIENRTCPHCGGDPDDKPENNITKEDKRMFLQALLGMQTFCKSYELYGGSLHVEIRDLTPEETDLCFRQLYADKQKNRIANAMDELEAMSRYRLALQLMSLIPEGKDAIAFPRSVEDWGMDKPPVDTDGIQDTVLLAVWTRFVQMTNLTGSMHRILMRCVGQFNRLVPQLELRADDPDFVEAVD